MTEDTGYSTQDEELIWYDEAPEYRTIYDLVSDLKTNGFRALLPYNKYKDSEEFLAEIGNIRRRYRKKNYGSNNEIDYSMSDIIFKMIKILNNLSKPDLSVEDIDKLSIEYYIKMKILERLHTILYGDISEYHETTYFSKLYFWIKPIII